LVGEPELKTPLGRLGCILSSDAIQSELLSVIKYIINKKEDNFSKKGKLNDMLIQVRQTDGLKLCTVYGNKRKESLHSEATCSMFLYSTTMTGFLIAVKVFFCFLDVQGANLTNFALTLVEHLFFIKEKLYHLFTDLCGKI
jgi:hypothetical protein